MFILHRYNICLYKQIMTIKIHWYELWHNKRAQGILKEN